GKAVIGREVEIPAQAGGVITRLCVRPLVLLVGGIIIGIFVVFVLIGTVLERQLPVQRMLVVQLMTGAQVEARQVLTVGEVIATAIQVEAIVIESRKRDAHGAAFPAEALPGVPVFDATLAGGIAQLGAQTVVRVAGDDVD